MANSIKFIQFIAKYTGLALYHIVKFLLMLTGYALKLVYVVLKFVAVWLFVAKSRRFENSTQPEKLARQLAKKSFSGFAYRAGWKRRGTLIVFFDNERDARNATKKARAIKWCFARSVKKVEFGFENGQYFAKYALVF